MLLFYWFYFVNCMALNINAKAEVYKGEGLRVHSCLRNCSEKDDKYLMYSQDEKGSIVVDASSYHQSYQG